MSDKTPMTEYGYRALQEELTRLKGIERPRISKALEEARAHGDLSENAEYDAAKQEQGLLEARIRMIEGRLSTAYVVEFSKLSGSKVIFGATVELQDVDTSEEKCVTIVGEDESIPEKGIISYISPLARALISKEEGDTVRVRLPNGEREYEIMTVRFEDVFATKSI